MNVEKRVKELGLKLPLMPPPTANYIPVRKSGNWAYVSGHAPVNQEGKPCMSGQLGREYSIEEGYQAARLAALGCLSSLRKALGSLDKVRGVVKVLGFVNSAEGFTEQPKVVNGASDFFVEVFGEKGKHARSAVGMAELPGNIPVEIELIVEVEE